jgi:hypothetical protein
MAQSKTTTLIRPVRLSQTLAEKADQRAAQLGLSIPEYIRSLIMQDTPASQQIISPEAEKKYLRDIVEFLEEEKKAPRSGARSAKELMRQLDQEG